MPKVVFDRDQGGGDDTSVVTETETGHRGDKREKYDKEGELVGSALFSTLSTRETNLFLALARH